MPLLSRSLCRLAAASTLALAACRDAPAVTTCCLVQMTIDPTSATLLVGDTLPVRIAATGATSPVTVRWRSTRPDVVRLDTTVAAGAPAILRAVGAGADTVLGTILLGGAPPYDARLPVTVRARPSAAVGRARQAGPLGGAVRRPR